MIEKDDHVLEKEPQYKLRRVSQNLYRMDPGDRYYVITRKNGRLFRQSLKTSDRQIAERRLREIIDKFERVVPGSGRMTFNDLYERWKNTVLAAKDIKPNTRIDREQHARMIYKIIPSLKDLTVRDITTTMCETWFVARKQQVGAQRVNNELDTFKMILELAVRDGVIMNNPARPIKRLKIPRTEAIIPTREQFAGLVKYMRTHFEPEAANFLELLGYSGMRRNEAAYITWGDVDLDRGWFKVTGGPGGTKNRLIRHVPLFPNLRALLENIKNTRGEVKPTDRLMKGYRCRQALMTACQRLSFPHFGHHAMRHFFITNAIEEGIDFRVIAGWAGHLDGGVLIGKVYGHLRQQHSEAMAAKMKFTV